MPGTALAVRNPGYRTLDCPRAVGEALRNWVEGVALEMSYQLSKETLSPIAKDPIHLEFAAWVGESPAD